MAQARPAVVLGRVHGLFGVRGWIKVYSYTRPPANLLDYPHWLIGAEGARDGYCVLDARRHGRTLIARLGDARGNALADRDVAASLLEQEIAVARSALPALGEGEYYWADLLGMAVVNREHAELGHVAGLMETGANDVLVVHGERERLIPFVTGEFIDEVDLDARRMIVDWDPDF